METQVPPWDKVVKSRDFKRSIITANVIAERLNDLKYPVSLAEVREEVSRSRELTRLHTRKLLQVKSITNKALDQNVGYGAHADHRDAAQHLLA